MYGKTFASVACYLLALGYFYMFLGRLYEAGAPGLVDMGFLRVGYDYLVNALWSLIVGNALDYLWCIVKLLKEDCCDEEEQKGPGG